MDECLIWNSAWIPVAAKPFTIFAGSLAICIQTERNNRKNLEWLIVHPVSAINSPVFFSHFDFIGAKINVNINSIRAIVSCVDKYNTTSEIYLKHSHLSNGWSQLDDSTNVLCFSLAAVMSFTWWWKSWPSKIRIWGLTAPMFQWTTSEQDPSIETVYNM